MQHVTVQVKLGDYTFQGRAVESLEIRQAVGEHVECTLVFDRDPRATQSETARVESAKLADAQLQVILSKSLDTPAGANGAATASAAGGLFSGAGLAGAAVSTARAAVGAAVRTAITNRHGSGRVTSDAVLAETGNAVGPQIASGVGSLFGFGGAVGGGAGNGNAANGGGSPNLLTGAGFAGAAQSTGTDVLKAAVSTGISNQHGSGRITTNAVMGALGAAASMQVGRAVDALTGAPTSAASEPGAVGANPAGASPAGANSAGHDGPAVADDAVKFLAFDGQVREVKVEYRAEGGARFTIRAFSRSYELSAHADQRYFAKQTVPGLAGVLDVAVAGSVPAGAPRDYLQRGESRWAFYARVAAGEGLQLRPTWGRRPGESASQAAEVAQGFTSERHAVTWGRDLIEFALVARPTNHGVTGAFTDPAAKHSHTFRGVRKDPEWLGGAKPLVDALKQVSTKDAGGGDPGHVEVGGLGGTRARTLEEFRTRLERASEARLGGAIEGTGTSTEPGLRAGDRIDITSGTGGGAASWALGTDEYQGTYGLTSVIHHWAHGLYKNTFTATPWAHYHPTPKVVEQSLARMAEVLGGADAGGTEHAAGSGAAGIASTGVALATVIDDDDPKKLGRVRVQYAFMEKGEKSHWLRVAGHGGGKGHGAGHVPLKGNMVAVAAVKNDDEHPLVIGAVYDQMDAGGHTKDRIQMVSRSGSGFSLNTGQGGASDVVELHTPGGKTMVHLLNNLVTIHSEGDISIEAPNGEVRIHAKSMTTVVDTDVVREVTGDVHDTVQGSVLRAVKGDVHDTVQGQTAHDVTGDSSTTAANVKVTSKGTMDAIASGTHTIKGGQVTINP